MLPILESTQKKSIKYLYWSIWFLLVIFSVVAALYRPHLHHDGWTYFSAAAQAKSLVPGRDYFELYGVVGSAIESWIIKLENRLLLIRLFGAVLNILIARQTYLIARFWMSRDLSQATSLIWFSTNPTFVSSITQDLASSMHTWPNQYGALLSMIALRIIIQKREFTNSMICCLGFILALLPFIRLQFVVHFLVLLFAAVVVMKNKIDKTKIVLITFGSILIFTFYQFKSVYNLLSNLEFMLSFGKILVERLYGGLQGIQVVQYYFGYLLMSGKFVLVLVFVISGLYLCTKFVQKKVSLQILFYLTISFTTIIIILFFKNLLTSKDLDNPTALLTKVALIVFNIPYLFLLCGLVISLSYISRQIFNKKRDWRITLLALLSVANLSTLFPMPDIGKLWTVGSIYVFWTIMFVNSILRIHLNTDSTLRVILMKGMLSIVASASILGLTQFIGKITDTVIWRENDVFQGMFIPNIELDELRDIQSFATELNGRLDLQREDVALFCPDGFFHVIGDQIISKGPNRLNLRPENFWQSKDELNSLETIGFCGDNYEEISNIEQFLSQYEVIRGRYWIMFFKES